MDASQAPAALSPHRRTLYHVKTASSPSSRSDKLTSPPASSTVQHSPSSPDAKRWMELVRKACYAGVQSGLRDGWAPVNSTDATGYTALMRCCVSGQLLEVLLGSPKCDVNVIAASDGSTALLLAARHRSARTVHALLRRGAIFTRDVSGCSVLHKAAANTDPAVVKLLLQAQADPCARDREGRCPLATAMLHGNEATALALLEWQRSWAANGVLRASSSSTFSSSSTSLSSSSSLSSCVSTSDSAASSFKRADVRPLPSTKAADDSSSSSDCGGTRGSSGGGSDDSSGVIGACSDGCRRTDDDCSGGDLSSGVGLDQLPDDCLEVILQQLNAMAAAARATGARASSSSTSAGVRERSDRGGGAGEAAAGGGGNGLVDGSAIVASVAASVVAASAAARAEASGFAPPRHLHGPSAPLPSSAPALQPYAGHVPSMACVCSRFRAVCRSRAISAWLAVDGVNAPIACFHPRGQHTTLLHVAASEGMEEACELLLHRGAHPLALDSCGRAPLQVARGRASLIAKLSTAQDLAKANISKAEGQGGTEVLAHAVELVVT